MEGPDLSWWSLPVRRANGEGWVSTAEIIAAVEMLVRSDPSSGSSQRMLRSTVADAWAELVSEAHQSAKLGEVMLALLDTLEASGVINGQLDRSALPPA